MKIFDEVLRGLSPEVPILIAGPTASGKSALAAQIVQAQGGVILNGDALQVFSDWRVLTARPSAAEEATLPHALYGHVPGDQAYSVGAWLRDIHPFLAGDRPVIVGGTGLYFSALTEGLAEIPPIPPEIQAQAQTLDPATMRAALDPETVARIDLQNPRRIQRAWAVQEATGKGMAAWQDSTPPPLLPLEKTRAFVLDAPKEWLSPRIEARFAAMIEGGALEEAQANAPTWHPRLASAKAIGAAELVAHVQGQMTLAEAQEAAIIATRQYAKRQRTWFRARMQKWQVLLPEDF